MVHIKCYPQTDPNVVFSYCPSFGAAIAFTIIFTVPTILHIYLAIRYRKPFCIILIMGALWEVFGYALRTYNITSQLLSGIYTAQLLLILLAPLWINAFAYMVLGRMIHFYLSPDKIMGIRARRVTSMFVWFDVFSFIVQLSGGLMTSSTNPISTQKTGLNVYTGGVGLQLAFIVVFMVLAIKFHIAILNLIRSPSSNSTEESKPLTPHRTSAPPFSTPYALPSTADPTTALPLLYTLYLVLALIIIRNIYRLIEFSLGINNYIVTHEWCGYVFDAVPMLFAFIAFIVLHPGKILQGPNSDFSEENRRLKEEKKLKKAAKKARKQGLNGMELPMNRVETAYNRV